MRTRRSGLTLVEGLVASVVLVSAVAAIAVSITSGHLQLHYAVDCQSAVRLAEDLMERVRALPYDDPDGESDPGPEPGETDPSDFDNADDFHGYSESAGALRDAADNLLPDNYQHFSRSVTAGYGSETVADLGGAIPGLIVTVTVQDHKGQTWTVSRFIPE